MNECESASLSSDDIFRNEERYVENDPHLTNPSISLF